MIVNEIPYFKFILIFLLPKFEIQILYAFYSALPHRSFKRTTQRDEATTYSNSYFETLEKILNFQQQTFNTVEYSFGTFLLCSKAIYIQISNGKIIYLWQCKQFYTCLAVCKAVQDKVNN